ncbi:hypothetical protein [Nocardia amamiensis]|uniref:hypothetical protein n=1 Tax=Nocardia amamiensis TaxID=404578 RepID=UPI0033C08C54
MSKDIYVTNYGTGFDGIANDDQSIAAALAHAVGLGNGVRIVLPRFIRVTQSIDLSSGLTLTGLSSHPNTGIEQSTTLIWAGDSDGTIIKAWGRDMAVENMSIKCASGFSCNRAIDITWPDATNPCTAVLLRNLFIRANNMQYGVVYGDVSQGLPEFPVNTEYMRQVHVYIESAEQACVYVPNTTGQCKNYRFDHCSFSFSPYGIRAYRCGIRTFTCGFGHCSIAAVSFISTSDTHAFYETDSETCARFYELPGNTNSEQPLLISGGRFDATIGLHPDGRYITTSNPGPITIVGASFAAPENSNWNMYSDGGGDSDRSLTTIGCWFPKVAGGYDALVTGHPGIPGRLARWSRMGCQIRGTSDPAPTYIPDQIIRATNRRVLRPVLLHTGSNQLTVAGRAYAVYLGYLEGPTVIKHVEVLMVTPGTGTQVAEFALGSTPLAPNKASQTVTMLTASGVIDSLAATVAVKRNTTAFNSGSGYTVAGGTHLWAIVRTMMGTTQPTFSGVSGDLGQGQCLISNDDSIGPLTSMTTYTFKINNSGGNLGVVGPWAHATAD